MSRTHPSWFLLALLFTLFSCKTSQFASAPNPGEQYAAYTEEPLISNLTIPVTIAVEDLVKSLNARLQGVLYEDKSYSDNGNDDLMLRLTKTQQITMLLAGNAIKYRVPLKIWAKQKLLLGAAEVEGDLALNMKTTYGINPDWSLNTQTTVEYHEWLSKPVLKTGLGDLNIESLANLMLNRSKTSLSQSLDRIVSQQFSLKPFVQTAWASLQDPVLLHEQYQMWIKTTPVAIGITPLLADGNNLRAKVSVECHNDVTFGEKPAFRANSSLPNLRKLDDAPDEFQMRIATDVPFAEAERLARASMIGQVFESGNKKVVVDDLKLWGNNDRLVANAKLSGSFNGNIFFIGKPVMNPEKNRIEVGDLDFHLETRNFLHKTAAWMFAGTIKKRMTESMNFPLDRNIAEVRTAVQEKLRRYEIKPGITLTGNVDSLTVDKTRVTPSGIRVELFSKGKVNMAVKGL
ncbi:MAG: DUF4403 family protein [Saprospiraceae bacterium]